MSNSTLPPSTTKPDASGPSAAEAGDTFQKLHKMSTTAGVGAHDYVAVNTPAVVAIVAGLASMTALISPVMLAVPAFAIVCAVIAWVQIGRSNGTQTGRLIAVLGLLIALGFAGYVVNQQVAEAKAFAESRRDIGKLFTDFTDATSKSDHQAAYAVFGPSFQSRNPYPAFTGFLKMLEDLPTYGRIVSADWNQRLAAEPDTTGEGSDLARAAVVLKFEKGDTRIQADVVLVRRRSNEKWTIEQMLPLFEQDRQQQNPGGGPQ
jgi:hypothetical protein